MALKRLHDQLTTRPTTRTSHPAWTYWRGFALWRRAINGFNETPYSKDLEEDLNGAIDDFNIRWPRIQPSSSPKSPRAPATDISCF